MALTLAWMTGVLVPSLAAQERQTDSRPTLAQGAASPSSQPSGLIRTTLDLEITDRDPLLEGHGPSTTIDYTTKSRGTLIAWALSERMDLFLRATPGSGRGAGATSAPIAPTRAILEDDDGGGYPTPSLRIETEAGRVWTITVAASNTAPATPPASQPARASSAGAVTLFLIEVAENDATLAIAREAASIRADASHLAAAGRPADARRALEEVGERLLVMASTQASCALDRVLFDLGGDAYALGDLDCARRCFAWSAEFRSSIFGGDHPDLQRARVNLATVIKTQGRLEEARRLEEKILEVRTRTLPEDHPDLVRALQNLAATIRELGDLATAHRLFEKVLAIRTRTLPDDHPDLQKARLNLAAVLQDRGLLATARELDEKVVGVFTRTLPDDHPDLQRARQNLASVIMDLGDLDEARLLFEKVLEILSRTLPSEHPNLQRARLNVAAAAYARGDLARARQLFEGVLEVCSRTLPDDHPDVQRARFDLAAVLRDAGDLAGAHKLFEKVLEIRSRTLPDDHLDLQRARLNVAVDTYAFGELALARRLFESVVEVYSRTLPDDHPDFQLARQDLAATLYAQGDVAAARRLFEKVVAVRASTLPADHPDLQLARLDLAATLDGLGDFTEANKLQRTVLDVYSRTLPDDHAHLQAVRRNLAVTLSEIGDRRGAATVAQSLLRGMRSRGGMLARLASPREEVARLSTDAEAMSVAISLLSDREAKADPAVSETELFWTLEERRARLLVASRLRHIVAGAGATRPAAEARLRAQAAATAIARQAAQGHAQALAQAVRERDAAERELIELLRPLPGASRLATEPTAQALAARLHARDALVSYFRYGHLGLLEDGASKSWTMTPRYLVWVVRPGRVLTRIDLGEAAAIEKAIERYRFAIGAPGARGVDREDASSLKAPECGARLRELIFDPVRVALGDATTITFALSDALHQVPIEALPDDEGALGDHFQIHLRSTLQEILHDLDAPALAPRFLGLGGIDYDAAVKSPAATDTAAAPSVALARGAGGRAFADLPQTAAEVEAIGRYFQRAYKDAGLTMLEEEMATKAAFLASAPKARFLHLATHGFFAPDSVPCITDPNPIDRKLGLMPLGNSREDAIGFSPMVLCGLALAGANRPEDERGHVEGCITAEEMASMDLSGCELCVLSACDTSVGIQRAGMGIASLQTALHAAGVRTAITSLWKVPDQATRELMTDFYRRMWIEKKPKWQALWEAKVRLRDMLDENGRPKYTLKDWAAWVLSGEPD